MTTDETPPKHKRRPRYKGTHPRKFNEKYKEFSQDQETKEKIMARGGTPAGTHRPIMVKEILEFLDPQPGQIFVDATLGYGGHSQEILARLKPGGHLLCFDRDPIELPKTEARLRELLSNETEPRLFTVTLSNYSELKSVLSQHGLYGKVDGVLADLGLSSMQIDDPTRGFSFKNDGPLDLRMNPLVGKPASEILSSVSEQELTRYLEEYSDEPRAKWCAHAIVKRRKENPIETTKGLEATIRAWLKTLSVGTQAKEGDTPIRRVFQALRIVVNEEFLSLENFLQDLPLALKQGGRTAVLSFHSGEDRRVKKAFQSGLRSKLYSEISDEIMRPSFEEQRENTRSKSAKLRTAIRA